MKKSVEEYLLTGVGEMKGKQERKRGSGREVVAGGKVGRIGGYAGLIEGGHP